MHTQPVACAASWWLAELARAHPPRASMLLVHVGQTGVGLGREFWRLTADYDAATPQRKPAVRVRTEPAARC